MTSHTFGQLIRGDPGPDEDPLGATVIVLLEMFKAVISASIRSQSLKDVGYTSMISRG